MPLKLSKGVVKRVSADYQSVEFSTSITTTVADGEDLEQVSADLHRQIENLIDEDIRASGKRDPWIQRIVTKAFQVKSA